MAAPTTIVPVVVSSSDRVLLRVGDIAAGARLVVVVGVAHLRLLPVNDVLLLGLLLVRLARRVLQQGQQRAVEEADEGHPYQHLGEPEVLDECAAERRAHGETHAEGDVADGVDAAVDGAVAEVDQVAELGHHGAADQ